MDKKPLQITDDYIKDIISRGKGYHLVILTKGPSFDPSYDTTEHLRYLLGLREQGIIDINGPASIGSGFRETRLSRL